MVSSSQYEGSRFGRLTVLRFVRKTKKRHEYWLCLCDCGNEKVIRLNSLLRGDTRSCSCLNRERASQVHSRHNRYSNLFARVVQGKRTYKRKPKGVPSGEHNQGDSR